MSRLQELQRHFRSLDEIRGIMGAMKNLALMETRKLSRFLVHQRRAVGTLEKAAADFLAHFPSFGGELRNAPPLYLAIGSERGFCGDFNDAIIKAMTELVRSDGKADAKFVAVGHRLATKLEGNARIVAFLAGPSVTEDVQPFLSRLGEALARLDATNKTLQHRLAVIYQNEELGCVSIRPILPIQVSAMGELRHGYPPLLNLDPQVFYSGLVEHYLFAVLHDVFYASLMAENRRRLQHMEQAIDRMDIQVTDLKRKYNTLRQEEITEEIEVILLSADSLDAKRG